MLVGEQERKFVIRAFRAFTISIIPLSLANTRFVIPLADAALDTNSLLEIRGGGRDTSHPPGPPGPPPDKLGKA